MEIGCSCAVLQMEAQMRTWDFLPHSMSIYNDSMMTGGPRFMIVRLFH